MTSSKVAAVRVIKLPVDVLDPNEYNPNRMTQEEFAELVKEVRHLKRICKPIVVRPNGDRYTIVDGEHNWRAACEVGLRTIPCEIIDVDDFEAMRQTWKRNRSGSENPLAAGEMFQRMMESRGFSQRQLAGELNISEATVRNYLNYVEVRDLHAPYVEEVNEELRAMDMEGAFAKLCEVFGVQENASAPECFRESTADDMIAKLTVRQVRMYLTLPDDLRDIWLCAGAPLVAISKEVRKGRPSEFLSELANSDSLGVFFGDPTDFDASLRRAKRFLKYRKKLPEFDERDEYLAVAARYRFEPTIMQSLVGQKISGSWTPSLSVDEWRDALETARSLPDLATVDDRRDWVGYGVTAALNKKGIAVGGVRGAVFAMQLENIEHGPDFVAVSELLTHQDKSEIASYTHESEAEDIVLAAKRRVCNQVETLRESGNRDDAGIIWRCHREVELIKLERLLQAPAAATGLTDLCSRLAHTLSKNATSAGEQIDGRSVQEVLQERLMGIAAPELAIVAGLTDKLGINGVIELWLGCVRSHASHGGHIATVAVDA